MPCPSWCLRAETLPGQEQSPRIPSGEGSLGLVSQGRGLFQGLMVSSSPFGSRASRGHRLFLLGTSSVFPGGWEGTRGSHALAPLGARALSPLQPAVAFSSPCGESLDPLSRLPAASDPKAAV